MKNIIFIIVITIIIFISALPVAAATLRSPSADGFTIETDAVPSLSPTIQTGFSESENSKPMRIAISADFIDYGQITPTNPIKRKINISVDPGSSHEYQLFTFENHPLRLSASGQTIPDTTCDNGACSQNTPSTWNNPFTFGFGYSFDDLFYRQFADLSKNEPMTAIAPGEMTIKVNVGQSFNSVQDDNALDKSLQYENTLIFLAIPKY